MFNNCSLFLLNDDTIKVCGINQYGVLGLGYINIIIIPTIIPNLNDVKSLGYSISIIYLRMIINIK